MTAAASSAVPTPLVNSQHQHDFYQVATLDFLNISQIIVHHENMVFQSRPAAFGPGFRSSFDGDLVEAWDNHLGCYGPNDSTTDSQNFTGKVVLLQKGGCSFVTKVRTVQLAGGTAVIVGDTCLQCPLMTMYAYGTEALVRCNNGSRRRR